jgi:hypothetical protein
MKHAILSQQVCLVWGFPDRELNGDVFLIKLNGDAEWGSGRLVSLILAELLKCLAAEMVVR